MRGSPDPAHYPRGDLRSTNGEVRRPARARERVRRARVSRPRTYLRRARERDSLFGIELRSIVEPIIRSYITVQGEVRPLTVLFDIVRPLEIETSRCSGKAQCFAGHGHLQLTLANVQRNLNR